MSHSKLGSRDFWPGLAGTVMGSPAQLVNGAASYVGERLKPLHHADLLIIDDCPKVTPSNVESFNFWLSPSDIQERAADIFGILTGAPKKATVNLQTTELPGWADGSVAGETIDAEIHVDMASGHDHSVFLVSVDISPLQAKYEAKAEQCSRLEAERDDLRAALEAARREAQRAQIELAGAPKLLRACSGALARAQRALRVIKSLADDNDAIIDTVALGLEAPPQYTA